MGRIAVQVNALSPGWSVLLTFDDPIAIGNVQVFNARYTQLSKDSRTGGLKIYTDVIRLINFTRFNSVRFWRKKPRTHFQPCKVLFVSKTSLNGESIPLPNFGFVFTEMPSWSLKPSAGKVLFYNRIIYDDECIDGKTGSGGAFQVGCPERKFQTI